VDDPAHRKEDTQKPPRRQRKSETTYSPRQGR
jgi:hypothetical protein